MRITEKIIREGKFWLSSESQHEIHGKLIISDGGEIELEMTDVFGSGLDKLNDNVNISRIQGRTEKGLVTLDNCFYLTRKNFISHGVNKARIYVNKAILGVAYEANEAVTINTFCFSVEGLEEWLHMHPIRIDYEDILKISIKCSMPKGILVSSIDGMEIQLTFEVTSPSLPAFTEAKIKHQAYIQLVSKEERPLSDFMAVAAKINSFLCFAIDKTVCIKNVSATSREVTREIGEKETSIDMEIFYQNPIFSPKEPKISPHEMLFLFPDIQENSSEIIKNWLEMYKVAEPALDLYFSQKIGAYRYLQAKFLVLAQGLEVYHRKIFGKKLTLRKRLDELLTQFESFYNNSGEIKKIAGDIVGVRNYLTHYNITKPNELEFKDKAQDASTLRFLYMKMESIFQLHFLKRIGFTDKNIKQIVQKNYQLKQKLDMKNPS